MRYVLKLFIQAKQMQYELADDPTYTTMVARHLAEHPETTVNYKELAAVLGCPLENAAACFGLMALEKSGEELPPDAYEIFFEPTQDRREVLSRIKQWYFDGIPIFE